jgi:hypothetical protein
MSPEIEKDGHVASEMSPEIEKGGHVALEMGPEIEKGGHLLWKKINDLFRFEPKLSSKHRNSPREIAASEK